MNIKHFPKKLDSKISCLRIKVPENLDMALEGLIRKVLREQPETDDIYAFAANYFETLLSIRDKLDRKEEPDESSSKLNEQEKNEMAALANYFPRPPRNRFSRSPVKNKGKKRKNSASKLVKLNSFEENENIKENIEPKTASSKTKQEDFSKRNENAPLKNSSDGNAISKLSKIAAPAAERVLSNLPVTDNIQKTAQTLNQEEAEVNSGSAKEENTFSEDNKNLLIPDPEKEMVQQELTEKVSESKTDEKLTQNEEQAIKGESDNDATQVETTDKHEPSAPEEDKLDGEIKREDITKGATETDSAIETREEIKKEDINSPHISQEEDDKKLIKKDEAEKEVETIEKSGTDENEDMKNADVEGKTSKQLTGDEDSKIDEFKLNETEKINVQQDNEPVEEQQEGATEANLAQENISETSENLDQKEEKEKISNNEAGDKLSENALNDKVEEVVSKDEDDLTEPKENIEPTEAVETLKTPDANTAINEIKSLNDSTASQQENSSLDKGTDEILEGDKGESVPQEKEKDSKMEEDKPDQKVSQEEIERTTGQLPQDLSENTEKIIAESDIVKENVPTTTAAENETQESEKSKTNLEFTEAKEANYIETDDSKALEISNKDEKEKEKEIDEDKKEENLKENKPESLKDEKDAEEILKLPDKKENFSKNEDIIVDDSSIADTTSDSQKSKSPLTEEKKVENEKVEDVKNNTNADNGVTVQRQEEDRISVEKPQSDKPADNKKTDESESDQNTLESKTDKVSDLPLETTADNATEINKQEVNETDRISTLEGQTNTSSPSNDTENGTSTKDEQNQQSIIEEESKSPNVEESESEKQKEILEDPQNVENADAVNSAKDSSSLALPNNEQQKEASDNKDLTGAQEESEESDINRSASVKTEKNDLENKKYSEQENAENSEVIINSEKISETDVAQDTKEKEGLAEALNNEGEAKFEKEEGKPMETLKKEGDETITAESESKTEEQSPEQSEKAKLITSSADAANEDSNKPVEVGEAYSNTNESNSDEKNKENENEEIIKENQNDTEEELCAVVDSNEIRRVQHTEAAEKRKSENLQEEPPPVSEEELCSVVDSDEIRRVQQTEAVNKVETEGLQEEPPTVPEEELCSVVATEEIRRIQQIEAAEKAKSENLQEEEEQPTVPEEELCSVVDSDEIRRVQQTEPREKAKSENLQEELPAAEEKIKVVTIEENTKDAEEITPPEENVPLKTIKAHYYDFLQVPETNIREYRVKPLDGNTTFLSPRESAHSIIRAYQFEKEASGKELWTLIENKGPPTGGNENEQDDDGLEADELMTPSSVTSMAVSEMSTFSVNETFLDSERLHSSYDKRYQVPGEMDTGSTQTESDNQIEEKKEVEEIIEKKTVGKTVAVPLPPRDSNETIEEENEEPENLKNLKEKYKKKKGGLPSNESNDGSSNNTKSVDSENFAFISVDIETVIGTQEIDEEENEELERSKIPGEAVALEVEVETKVDVIPEEAGQEDDQKTLEQESVKRSSQLDRKISHKELSSNGNEQIDLDQHSVETTETTSSSALTEIKRLDSSRKNLTRSSTQNLLTSQSLDKSMKIGISEESAKKKKFVKTKSLSSLHEGISDKDIWKKIESELEEAATKIQSKFRRKKKKLQRGDAIQITSESSRSITPVEPEAHQQHHQQASGEFHDSIVLSIFPR